jgi:ankyrin repeat protein
VGRASNVSSSLEQQFLEPGEQQQVLEDEELDSLEGLPLISLHEQRKRKVQLEDPNSITSTGNNIRTRPDVCGAGGAYELLICLKRLNVELNQVDKFGRTPLFCACASGNFEVVCFLCLEAGCDPTKVLSKNHNRR